MKLFPGISITPDFLKQIQFFQNLVEKRAPRGFLIYTGDQDFNIHSIDVICYKREAEAIFKQ
jgi:hypothetical protein